MGVDNRELRGWKQEMNEQLPQTASPVLLGQAEDVPTVQLFGSLKDQEDVQALKSRMKFTLDAEICPETGSGEIPVLFNALGGNELSMSLPNLNIGLDTECMNKVNEKHIRSSLSDIYDTPSNIISDGQTESYNPLWNKSLSEITKRIKKLDVNQIRLVDFPSGCIQENGADSVTSPNLVKPCINGPRDLTINVSRCNNSLSAVLENIPLIYIPHTKQLISVNNSGKPGRIQSKVNGIGNTTTCKNTADLNITPPNQQVLPARSDTNSDTTCTDFADFSNLGSCDDTLTSPSGHTLCLQNGNTTVVNSSSGPNSTSLSNTKFLSNTDLENSMALSQDSDASSRSEHTVIHQDDFHAQGKLDDFDAESIDELTKISLDRDSPGHTLHRTSTMGSLSINDASSFSSISSISTGTDFSASAASCSDEYGEMKGVVMDSDEAGFMEINLHSRNTFERSRNSSQDSGIDEKGYHGAKPKRRGIAGFFTR